MRTDPNRDYIQSLSLFGSFLHGDYRPDSDIDLLFEMRKIMSLFQIIATKQSLEKKLGRKVDLVEQDSLVQQIKDKVRAEAKIIYER